MNPSLNQIEPSDVFSAFADLSTRPEAREGAAQLVDHVAETTLIGGRAVTVTCKRCEQPVSVRREVDEFGTGSIVGGVRIRGRWICSACEYDEVVDYLFDLELAGHEAPIYEDAMAAIHREDGSTDIAYLLTPSDASQDAEAL